jgi:hypothetical protein
VALKVVGAAQSFWSSILLLREEKKTDRGYLPDAALAALDALSRGQEEARAKVDKVRDELSAAHQRAGLPPALAMPFRQACAHLAALEAGREVVLQAKHALFKGVGPFVLQCPTGSDYQRWLVSDLDVGLAGQYFEAMVQHFDGTGLVGLESLAEQIEAEFREAQAARGPAPLVLAAPTAPKGGRSRAGVRRRPRVSLAKANERMREALEGTNNATAICWTAEEWGQYVKCSPSTIVRTDMWKECKSARERRKDDARAHRQQSRNN